MSLKVVSNIDLNGFIEGSNYFSWHEFLYLHDWDMYVFPTIEQHKNILTFVKQIEQVRNFLNIQMIVTSMLRPREYNRQIDGSRFSKHIDGRALDFICDDLDFNKNKLKSKLDEFNIRMEDHSGKWIHIDNALPGPSGRFFKP